MLKAITNGRIVTENRIISGAVLIDGAGRIADILPGYSGEGEQSGEEVLDAGGAYVVPGGIDGHVHFGGFGLIPIADDFYTGSKAALAGGTTTVVDFCESAPGEDPLSCIARRKRDGAISLVDFAFHFTFTKNYPEELRLLDSIAAEGISAFKAFTYYDNTALAPGDLREIMGAIHDRGTLLVHGEEKTIIDREKAKVAGAEKNNMLQLSLTRPNVSEQIAVETVLAIAKETETTVCIAHASAAETADIRKREREAGNNRLILETCPHYLQLTRDKLRGPQGALYTMNPPLRGREDTERLWRAVAEGDIGILSTDHCPYLKRDKLGKDFLTVPCGVDGVQTRMLYLFSEGVIKRNLPVLEFVRMTATNAALFYHLYPRKGVIRKGSDADLAIIDPAGEWLWNTEAIAGATDYSVLEGLKLTGRILRVIKGGETVVRDGKVLAEKGSGRFIPTEASCPGVEILPAMNR